MHSESSTNKDTSDTVRAKQKITNLHHYNNSVNTLNWKQYMFMTY